MILLYCFFNLIYRYLYYSTRSRELQISELLPEKFLYDPLSSLAKIMEVPPYFFLGANIDFGNELTVKLPAPK